MHVSILAQPSLSWMTMGKWFSLWPQQLLKQLGLGYPHLTGCLAHLLISGGLLPLHFALWEGGGRGQHSRRLPLSEGGEAAPWVDTAP